MCLRFFNTGIDSVTLYPIIQRFFLIFRIHDRAGFNLMNPVPEKLTNEIVIHYLPDFFIYYYIIYKIKMKSCPLITESLTYTGPMWLIFIFEMVVLF